MSFLNKNSLFYALTLLPLLMSCAPESEKKSTAEKVENSIEEKEDIITPDYVKYYDAENANKIGAYLSARIARFHYDFDAAASHAVRAFELDKHKNLYIQDQGVRLALTKQGFETATDFSHAALEKNTSKVTPFIALVSMVDHIYANEPQKALSVLKKYQEDFNIPVNALIGSLAYYINNDAKKTDQKINYLGNYELFEFLKLYHKALLALVEKDEQKALNLFIQAQQYHDPMAARAALFAAWIKQKNGDIDAAKNILENATKRYPDYTLTAAFNEINNQGRFAFTPAATAQDVLSEGLYKIGIIYARENDYETALAFFFMANHITPENIHIESAIAETFVSIKNYTRAAEFFTKISKRAGRDIKRDAILNIIFSLSASKQQDKAIETLKDAITSDPEFSQFHHALGDLYRQKENFNQAITEYNKAFEFTEHQKKKSSWRLHYVRGIAYERMKNWDAAEKDLLKAMEYVPNNAEVVNYLAYSWIDRGVNLKKALLLLDKAVRRAPENGYIVDSLGWAYYNLGQYDKATEILLRAVELTPGDPIINEHMGDAFWKVGRKREAYFQWQHAMQFNPTDEDAQRLKDKIEMGLTDYLKHHQNTKLVKDYQTIDIEKTKMNNI